jgi:carbohydrate diacid regulator
MDEDDIEQLAAAVDETIQNETSVKSYIGIGGVKENLFQLRDSYVEATKAIEVGRVYNTSNRIYMYSTLLLERFLHEVPLNLCERYSKFLFCKGI